MSEHRGKQPVPVPKTSVTGKRAGESDDRWSWVEPLVWTVRMLAALVAGVKGGKWYSLTDKFHPVIVLKEAFARVQANKGAAGVDHVTIKHYAKDAEANLARLSEELRTGSYRPQSIRRHFIAKPGSREKRPLGIPTVRDRVVQTALRFVLEPIFERDFATHSYGFRPGRGCKDALRRVDQLLKAGYVHIVDADLKSYFDTIPKDRLLAMVGEKVADGRILALIESFLNQKVLDGVREWTPEEGTPQGAVISPLLSNIYLDPLDHRMEKLGFEMVRYADDFVVLCRSPQDAAAALAEVQRWTAQAGLTLHPDKTRLVDARDVGFDFLGYTFKAGRRRPRKKSQQKFRDTVRMKTKRTTGQSLPHIIADVNRTLRGWFEYFKHSDPRTFRITDGWVRRRLRSILRKRIGGHGCSKVHGQDHRRWPNAYFAGLGLFNLQKAYALVRQSS